MIKKIKNKLKAWWNGEVLSIGDGFVFGVSIKRPRIVQIIIWVFDGLKKHWKFWLLFTVAVVGLIIKLF